MEEQDNDLEDDVFPAPDDTAAEGKEPVYDWLALVPAGAKQGDTRVLKNG